MNSIWALDWRSCHSKTIISEERERAQEIERTNPNRKKSYTSFNKSIVRLLLLFNTLPFFGCLRENKKHIHSYKFLNYKDCTKFWLIWRNGCFDAIVLHRTAFRFDTHIQSKRKNHWRNKLFFFLAPIKWTITYWKRFFSLYNGNEMISFLLVYINFFCSFFFFIFENIFPAIHNLLFVYFNIFWYAHV